MVGVFNHAAFNSGVILQQRLDVGGKQYKIKKRGKVFLAVIGRALHMTGTLFTL
jgi:hypothetical protein